MSYIVWHPDTGTIVDADNAFLVDVSQLPADFDEWEDYLETYGADTIDINLTIIKANSWDIAIGDKS